MLGMITDLRFLRFVFPPSRWASPLKLSKWFL